MTNFTNREKSILVGLYFSKFDLKGLSQLGFGRFTEAFNVIGFALGVKPRSIKNYRDEFDHLFPNNRLGWHKRPMRAYCEIIYKNFAELSLSSFTQLIKKITYKEYDIDVLMEKVDVLYEDESGAFAKRLMTGQAAEQYFLDEFKSILDFNGFEIKNTTKLGCGFDFKLFTNDIFYAVEVKGLNDTHGNVTLTEKEHTVASILKERYFLFVVRNFKEDPIHDIYKNPLNSHLNFNLIEQKITQLNWTTKV